MKPVPSGHTFTMRLRVDATMTARFFGVELHPVYATFAIAQHAEYAGRQAILSFVESDEDAVGTSISLDHRASAPVGAIVEHTARVESVEGRSITCSVTVRWGDRLLAEGHTVQRVVNRGRLQESIASLAAGPDGLPDDQEPSHT